MSEGKQYIYRITSDRKVEHVDSIPMNENAKTVIQTNYVPYSLQGERYFIVDSLTGEVGKHQWIIDVTPILEES